MLIQKTTPEERMQNIIVFEQIIFSFFYLNILGFKRILNDEVVFNREGKMAFLANLNSRFAEIKDHDIHGIIVCNGLRMDALPGCEVLEMHNAISEERHHENGFFIATANTPPRK
jgi:hypothetical protein